ncbi:FMN-binding protein [Haloplanus litoreus]|uniref:FMN-binding protein n=1 Tax=Haloplanus litoreus TaxID=767515 RepID=UPI003608DC7D
MTRSRRIAVGFALLLLLSMPATVAAVDRTTIDEPFSERNLSKVYPGADSFSEPSGQYRTVEAYRQVDGERELAGYVFLTSNVVDVEGYGNEPIEYLVSIDTDGTIRGVELVEQHEPFFDRISAIQRLRQFGYQMVGMSVTEEVTLRDAGSNEYHVDALTGASVTTRASIETVTRSARLVAREKGIVSASAIDGESANETAAANGSASERRMTLGDLGRGTALARWGVGTPPTPTPPHRSSSTRPRSNPTPSGRACSATRTPAPPTPTQRSSGSVSTPPGRPAPTASASTSGPDRAPPVHETQVDGIDWSAALVVREGLDPSRPFVLGLTLDGERIRRTYAPGGWRFGARSTPPPPARCRRGSAPSSRRGRTTGPVPWRSSSFSAASSACSPSARVSAGTRG